IDHEPSGFTAFFERVERHRRSPDQRVQVAMEGYNGWARPLDSQTLARGWALYNVNNLKLARYKEIFPAPAKTDAIDSRRMLELFALDQQPGVARNALQRVTLIPKAHRHLKYLTRRRRVLVQERAGRLTRLNCDLQALCPGLLSITGSIDNRWFLRFLTCRDRLTALPRVRASTLLRIRGVGRAYLAKIQAWQPTAQFAPDIAFGDMDVVTDARSILTLSERITELDTELERLACESQPAQGNGDRFIFGLHSCWCSRPSTGAPLHVARSGGCIPSQRASRSINRCIAFWLRSRRDCRNGASGSNLAFCLKLR
uniref:IS110 family transposase n=1 Tax=Thioalkalivibrio sp. ALE12 TaxID=1158170 RepID=UPI00036072A9